MLTRDDKAGLYLTVIFHLVILIVLLIAQIGFSLQKENSFVIDFTKQEEIEAREKKQRFDEEVEKKVDDLIAAKVDRMLAGMRAMPWLTVYGEPVAEGRYGVVSFNVNDVHPHDVATILDAGGVAVRAGHHCAQPLMEYLGIGSCCRASVAIYNTPEDVDALLENLENVRKVMGL